MYCPKLTIDPPTDSGPTTVSEANIKFLAIAVPSNKAFEAVRLPLFSTTNLSVLIDKEPVSCVVNLKWFLSKSDTRSNPTPKSWSPCWPGKFGYLVLALALYKRKPPGPVPNDAEVKPR